MFSPPSPAPHMYLINCIIFNKSVDVHRCSRTTTRFLPAFAKPPKKLHRHRHLAKTSSINANRLRCWHISRNTELSPIMTCVENSISTPSTTESYQSKRKGIQHRASNLVDCWGLTFACDLCWHSGTSLRNYLSFQFNYQQGLFQQNNVVASNERSRLTASPHRRQPNAQGPTILCRNNPWDLTKEEKDCAMRVGSK